MRKNQGLKIKSLKLLLEYCLIFRLDLNVKLFEGFE